MRHVHLPLVLLLAAGAYADEVHLVSGGKLVGKSKRVGDEVFVTTPHGETRVRADAVKSIIPGRTVWDDYADKVKQTDAKNPEALTALGDWCKEQGLAVESKVHWKAAIKIDPDHGEARKRLGFIRHDDKWLTLDEYYKARGFVKVDGEWISEEEARRRDASRLQREAATRASSRCRSTRSRSETCGSPRSRPRSRATTTRPGARSAPRSYRSRSARRWRR
jgi:hypothetical protein